MTMTLEQVRDWHLDRTNYVHLPITNKVHKEMADAIDAHLAQPEQSVDVEKVREVAAELDDYKNTSLHAADDCVAKDAEIERLQDGLAKHVDRVCMLESRLVAADALLQSMRNGAFNIGGWADAIDEYFQEHLQGADDEA